MVNPKCKMNMSASRMKMRARTLVEKLKHTGIILEPTSCPYWKNCTASYRIYTLTLPLKMLVASCLYKKH